MNRYEVAFSFRPNANRSEHIARTMWIDAPNRDAALLLAGNRLGLEETGMVPASIRVTVTRNRRL